MDRFDGEFDPSSERTLAAWIRHASRAVHRKVDSGKRVRNTWGTYPEEWDNLTKVRLIPHVLPPSHGGGRKDSLDRKVAIALGGSCVPSASW